MMSIFERYPPERLADFVGQLREHMHTPLYANAYLLIFNQGISAVLGLLYWIVAARLFSTEEVGKSSAIISTLVFLSALAELSLKSGMQRFVPRAGKNVNELVLTTYAVIFLATGWIAIGFFWLGNLFHFSDTLVGGLSPGARVVLVLATMFWTIFFVQDGVLMGLHQTLWVVLENTLFSVGKIIILIIGVAGLFGDAIVASWFIPAVLSVLLVNGLIFTRFIPGFSRQFRKTIRHSLEPISTRQIITSVGGDHVGSLFGETAVRLLPLMVINVLGKSANAFFYQAWLIASMIYLVSVNIAASYTVEAASAPNRMAHYSRQTLRHMLFLVAASSLALAVAAPLILRFYGVEYARQGTPLLRWLALAAIPYAVNAWFLSYARVKADIKWIIINQGFQCGVTLGLSFLWMPRFGIASIGVAWLIAQSGMALAALLKTGPLLFGRREAAAGTSRLPGDSRLANITAHSPETAKPREILHRVPVTGEETERERVHLFLSPHLDDAVLSCGGMIHRLASAGEQVVIITVFTGDLSEGTPISLLARRNLRSWGYADLPFATGNPFAARRREDRCAAQCLGVQTVHLGLLDGMYRRRPSPIPRAFYQKNIVGVPIDSEDEVITGQVVQEKLRLCAKRFAESNIAYSSHADSSNADSSHADSSDTGDPSGARSLRVYVPLGIGGHVDHRLLRCSAEAVFGCETLIYYEDFPYAIQSRIKDQENLPLVSEQIRLKPEEVQARISALTCYTSQIQGLFPSPVARYLEILVTRMPRVGEPCWNLYKRTANVNKSHRRMARKIQEYIHQAGGEVYWHVSAAQDQAFSAESRKGSHEE